MEPTVRSTLTDVYYVKDHKDNLEFYHAKEQEDVEEDEFLDE